MSTKLYLSDLHLGSQFFNSMHYINKLIQDDIYDEIYLLGDIFDIWDMTIEEIHAKYQSFFTALDNVARIKDVKLIKGNHDPRLERLKKYFTYVEFYNEFYIDREITAIYLHGHDFSDSILRYNWISKLLYYLIILPIHSLFKINLRDKYKDKIGSVAKYRGKSYYDDICLDIEINAIKKFQDEFNFLVMGHTHLPKHVDSEDGEYHCEYINCGDWIHNKSYAVYRNGKFKLIQLDEDYNVSESLK